jgi:putative tricarboxylic transport membrane protein
MIGRDTYHRATNYVWVLLGIGLCLASVRLGLGSLSSPESGLMPFLTGCFIGLLGLVLVLLDARGRKEEKKSRTETSEGMFSRKGVLSLTAMFLYLVLLTPLGFLISSFLLVFALFKIMEPRKWLEPLFLTVSSVLFSYLVFCVWLRVSFPKGIFGIG